MGREIPWVAFEIDPRGALCMFLAKSKGTPISIPIGCHVKAYGLLSIMSKTDFFDINRLLAPKPSNGHEKEDHHQISRSLTFPTIPMSNVFGRVRSLTSVDLWPFGGLLYSWNSVVCFLFWFGLILTQNAGENGSMCSECQQVLQVVEYPLTFGDL